MESQPNKNFYFSLIFFLALGNNVWGFKSPEHAAATSLAVQNAGSSAPDIAKFGPAIVKWSNGIGGPLFGALGPPAEQLAHSGNQSGTFDNDGGPFDLLFQKAQDAYLTGN